MSENSQEMTRYEKIATVARACHEANRAWCESHGDFTQAVWNDAEQWQRDSAIAGVEYALTGATPEEQHAAWVVAKERDGWTYGPVKDGDQKTHPCLVPYDQLPDMQRVKDALFLAIVDALAPPLKLNIRPTLDV